MRESEFILPDDCVIEEFSMIDKDGKEFKKLYKGKTGFYGDRSVASYTWAIGRHCRDCDKPTEAPYKILCEDCMQKDKAQRYNKLPFQEWDGETALCIFGTDEYFFNEDDIKNYCDENSIESTDLMLVLCGRERIPEFNIDHHLTGFWDFDSESNIPNEDVINEKVNEVIREYLKSDDMPWYPMDIRTTIKV